MANPRVQLERVPAGGINVDGRHYRGGEFLPFYVPREQMPQIDAASQPKLVVDAMIDGGGCTFEVVNVSSLHAHQRIDHHRAQGMLPELRAKPIIISRDNFILDGNHRWWSHVYQGETLINVIRLSDGFDIEIPWLLELPYVYKINPATPTRN